MTPYTKLQEHLDRYAYKKGQYKGDAPADSTLRSKYHFRVVKHGDRMCVRMYATNLIEVTPDNTVRISMGGWHTSTTKENINLAMRRFLGWGGIGSVRAFGLSQLAFRAQGKTYAYYDGMEFDAAGRLLSPPAVFERKRVDREATAEFRKDIEESGFKAMWPVLFATAEPIQGRPYFSRPIERIVAEEHHADKWPLLAEWMKSSYGDHKTAYAAIVRECTRGMTETLKTDVTVL